MAKGYKANKDRQDEIHALGKAIGKRAKFSCEWCGCKDDLRVWDYKPDSVPVLETLALLCLRCRDWADGRKAAANELRSIGDALWSNIPAVSEGAARVMASCKESWIREAIEESLIDESVKAEILK